MSNPSGSPSRLTSAQVWERVCAAARRGLQTSRPADSGLERYGYDIEAVEDLIANCTLEAVEKHEPDDDQTRPFYIVVLRIQARGERAPFYVKVALLLPAMELGRLLSFKY